MRTNPYDNYEKDLPKLLFVDYKNENNFLFSLKSYILDMRLNL